MVQAMSRAIDTDLKEAKGLKTLLVLTDGDDTRFMKNRELQFPEGVEIPSVYSQVSTSSASEINMVFFSTAIRREGGN